MAIMPMTHEEKVKMYRTIKKERLIEMLIAANNALDVRPPQILHPQHCNHNFQPNYQNTSGIRTCIHCGAPEYAFTTASTNSYPENTTVTFTS